MPKRGSAKALLPDALVVAGGSTLAYGAWLAWPPGGFILAGAMLIFVGLKIEVS